METCPDCGMKMFSDKCVKCGYTKGSGSGKGAPPSKKAPPMAGKRSLADVMRKK